MLEEIVFASISPHLSVYQQFKKIWFQNSWINYDYWFCEVFLKNNWTIRILDSKPSCRTSMNWIPFCWKSLECTLFSIHLNYYNLQHRSPMIYIVGWNPQYYAQCFECWFPHIRYVNHHKQCTSTTVYLCGPSRKKLNLTPTLPPTWNMMFIHSPAGPSPYVISETLITRIRGGFQMTIACFRRWTLRMGAY